MGIRLDQSRQSRGELFGDGAVNNGVFPSSVNPRGCSRSPVIFVIREQQLRGYDTYRPDILLRGTRPACRGIRCRYGDGSWQRSLDTSGCCRESGRTLPVGKWPRACRGNDPPFSRTSCARRRVVCTERRQGVVEGPRSAGHYDAPSEKGGCQPRRYCIG